MADDLRATLEAERSRAQRRVATLQRAYAELVAAAEGSNVDDEHDPEGATIAFERSQLAAQIERAQADIGRAEDALRRVAASTYGKCLVCGDAIAPARLEARPTAATCIACAAR